MKQLTILTILITFALGRGFSQQDSSIYLTGNSDVDFFGSTVLLKPLSANISMMQEDNSPPSEKSPWLAAAMSLLVPGTGELYSESYTKGGIFLGVEVASWIIAGVYNSKGNKQTEWFKKYANEHYSPVRYAEWVWRNIGSLAPGLDTTSYHLYYRPPVGAEAPPFDCLAWPELNRLEGEISSFTHRLPLYGEQQYFELIGKYKQFSKGWDSEDPYEPDHLTPGDQFYYYGVEFNKADHYYKISDLFISVIIVNHIVSAFDAYLTASKYNNSLHADVQLKMQPTIYGMMPTAQANLSYTF
ncbi:MAG: hypothetical protein HY964_06615 [Ignavibacteriales bacterium]|nr:hypothetical protein [Ignavibacteriales bacterium]